MLRKLLLPVALLLLAVLSFWLTDTSQDSMPEPVAKQDDRNPDGYMENFTTTILGADGLPVYELTAQSMAHYPYDDHSDFQAPLMTMHQDNGYRWTVVADTGRAEQGTQRILLQGEVVMHRVAVGDTAIDTEIITRDLLVIPEQDYAETDQHAVMTRPEGILEGIGVKAYFEDSRLQLLSEVKGRYEAPR